MSGPAPERDDVGGSDGSPLVTVVIMAYNEVANLEAVMREIFDALHSLGSPCEILIVDDGSTDGTGELADRLATTTASTRVVHHRPNKGLGGVYRSGFTEARGTYVTFFPADGQFPASIIADFVQRMPELDMVLGYLPDRKVTALGAVLSWGERVLYRVMFGPMPLFQGVLMFRRKLLDASSMRLESQGRGWAVLMEFILRVSRAGHRITSVPTAFRPRMSGLSKVNNWRTIQANFRQMIALRQHL